MARFSLLLPILLCLSFQPAYARAVGGGEGVGGLISALSLFFGVLVGLVLAGRLYAEHIARQSGTRDIYESSSQMAQMLSWARGAALLWTAAGLYALGWGSLVLRVLPKVHLGSFDLAVAVLMTLPSYVTWIALYWAQYPADRALREQSLVYHLDLALPVRQPPTLRQYLGHHLRTGPGLILLPIAAVLLTRDLTFTSIHLMGFTPGPYMQTGLYFGATGLVFLISPLLVRLMLKTSRLPAGELRTRLESLANRAGVRVTDVLVWNTGNSTANALVTGIVPQLRYVLISDLLLESMPDEQIEAVYAHELGHVVHRHMAWYGAFLTSLSILLAWLELPVRYLQTLLPGPVVIETGASVLSLGVVLYCFGMVSRRFENQADVFAARSLDSETVPPSPPLRTQVGYNGAVVFSESLRRVALMNNMPIAAHNFTHGSILGRTDALIAMAKDPGSTSRFDKRMIQIRIALTLCIIGGVVSAFFVQF